MVNSTALSQGELIASGPLMSQQLIAYLQGPTYVPLQ